MNATDPAHHPAAISLDDRTTEQRLFNADDTLRTATHGLELMEPWPFEIDDPEWLNLAQRGSVQDLPQAIKQDARARQHMGLRIMCMFGPATTLALQALRSTEPSFDAWWAPRSAALRADPVARFFWDMRVEVAHRGSGGAYNVVTQFTAQIGQNASNAASGFITFQFVDSPVGENADGHALGEEYLAKLGVLLNDAWSEFSPSTSTLALRSTIRRSGIMQIDHDGATPVAYELENVGTAD